MPKERINLLIHEAAIERARRYSRKHSTSISKLVSDYLAGLPGEEDVGAQALTPTVRRLLGLAAGADVDRDDYREHLYRKYGP